MNWEDERFVKIYVRDTGEWAMLSWDAQALLMQLLRKVDRSGVMQLGKPGRRALPAVLGHKDQATKIDAALDELIKDGCARLLQDRIVVPNFIAAQEAKQSDKLRQAESRARRREIAIFDSEADVTKRDEMSHDVTRGHDVSHDVTPRLDQTRPDEIRTDQEIPRAPARSPSPETEDYRPLHGSERQWPVPPPDKQPKPVQPSLLPDADKPSDKLVQVAVGILAELSAARTRVNPKARAIEPSDGNLKQILGRLRDKKPTSVEDLRHVIAVCEAQARRDNSLRWFDAVTPFRADNIGRYVAMDLAEAEKPAGGASRAGPWRPDPSTGSNDKSLDERSRELDEWMKR